MTPVDVAGVVLAAGLGKRLRPLTDLVPKPLCPVANVPLVDLAVGHVRTATSAVAVNVHHHRERLVAHLSEMDPPPARIAVEEFEPLGTAGALGNLKPWIDGRPTLVHNADAWHPAIDLAAAVLAGWDGERIRLLVVAPARPGLEDFADGEGSATFAGVSLLPWPDVERLTPEPTGLWEVSWGQAKADGRLELIRYDGPWFDTGTPSTYLAANLAASGGTSVIAPDAHVHPNAIVERSVVWSGATVHEHERLVEVIRADDDITVEAPQRWAS